MKSFVLRVSVIALFLTGCAGFQRDCSSRCATSLGGDWIIVQYSAGGAPINCWKLQSTAVSNEQGTDGIFWQDPQGHLVHISGWYNRVQINGNRWDEAAKAIGIDSNLCNGGAYAPASLK